jgi:hypothetical protein
MLRLGKGTLKHPNGDIFLGTFREGNAHGSCDDAAAAAAAAASAAAATLY